MWFGFLLCLVPYVFLPITFGCTFLKMSTPPVFAHYMVGQMSQDQALTDVIQAKALGFDALALNIISNDWWSTDSIGFLFQAALSVGFFLFFSFDMPHFSQVSEIFPLIVKYVSNAAYYKYAGLPFVSMYTLTYTLAKYKTDYTRHILRRYQGN